MLPRPGGDGHPAARVLQVVNHVAGGAEAEDEAVALRLGLQAVGEAGDDLAGERAGQQGVEEPVPPVSC